MVFSVLKSGQHLATSFLFSSSLLLSLSEAAVLGPRQLSNTLPQCSPMPKIPPNLPQPAKGDQFQAAIVSDGPITFKCKALPAKGKSPVPGVPYNEFRWVEHTAGSSLKLYNYGEVLGQNSGNSQPRPLTAADVLKAPRGSLGAQIGGELWGGSGESTSNTQSQNIQHVFYVPPTSPPQQQNSMLQMARKVLGQAEQQQGSQQDRPILWQGVEQLVPLPKRPAGHGALNRPVYIAPTNNNNSPTKAYRVFQHYEENIADTPCMGTRRVTTSVQVPYRALWLFYGPDRRIKASDGSTSIGAPCTATA